MTITNKSPGSQTHRLEQLVSHIAENVMNMIFFDKTLDLRLAILIFQSVS